MFPELMGATLLVSLASSLGFTTLLLVPSYACPFISSEAPVKVQP